MIVRKMIINNSLFLFLDFCISFVLVTKWKNKFCKQLLTERIFFWKGYTNFKGDNIYNWYLYSSLETRNKCSKFNLCVQPHSIKKALGVLLQISQMVGSSSLTGQLFSIIINTLTGPAWSTRSAEAIDNQSLRRSCFRLAYTSAVGRAKGSNFCSYNSSLKWTRLGWWPAFPG